MRTFAVSMTALMALLLGGGFVAYRAGVAEPPKAEERGSAAARNPDGPNATSEPEIAKNLQSEGEKPGDTGTQGGTTAQENQGQATAGSDAPGSTGEGQAQAQGSPDGTEGTQAAGEEGATGATVQGSRDPGQGSVPEANRINESTPSQNQASGRVNGGQAEVQAASVKGDPARGKVLFEANCQGCHGSNAKGQLGPSLVGEGRPANWEFAQFAKVLYDGIDPNGNMLEATMPRFRRTSMQPDNEPATDQKLADLQSYLKTLQ